MLEHCPSSAEQANLTNLIGGIIKNKLYCTLVEWLTDAPHNFAAIVLALLFSLAGIFTLQTVHKREINKNIPGPKPQFLLRNLMYLVRHRHQWPTEVAKQTALHKKTWKLTFPLLPPSAPLPPTVIYIVDATNQKHILLSNFKNYVKGQTITNMMNELLGKGIFVSDGLQWKFHRKIMSNMFSKNLMRYSATTMRQKMQDVLLDLNQRIEDQKNPCGLTEIDFKVLMSRIFFDVTSKIAFGVDSKTASMDTNEKHVFMNAFDEMSYYLDRRFIDPLFSVKKKLGIGSERRIAELKCIIDDCCMSLVAERRRSIERGDHVPTSRKGTSCSKKKNGDGNFDILAQYIAYAEKEQEEKKEGEGIVLSDSDLKDIITNVMIAGRDTSSNSLCWALYELERNPNVKRKVIDEVAQVCGRGDNTEYSLETMNQLDYTHCVLLETLRLHPIVPEFIKYAIKSDILPDGTHVSAGTGVAFSAYAMGRNEDVWGKDAAEFKPERFMKEMDREISPFKYISFNAGPRICLGKNLAMMNMKLVLSMLLSSDIEIKDRAGHSGEYQFAIIMTMKDSFPMEVKRKVIF